jgi:YhcH/YjgK/YiaL family protein
MVTDRLINADLYRGLSPRIAAALDYVRATDFAAMADGKYPVDEDRMFALVQRYTSKPRSEGRWEAHRKYIDLQVVFAGIEEIGYVSNNQLTAEPYDEAKDLIWLAGTAGQWVTLPTGHFTLLWPGDAHMPGIQVGGPSEVLKVVVKIAI